jgi:hypothetical protein
VENFVASRPEELMSAHRRTLMAVVRPAPYAQHVRETYAKAGFEAVAAFLAGDLWLLCVQDTEGGTRMIHGKDLSALGLKQEEAIALAKENLAGHLLPMRASAEIAPNGAFGSVEGDGYYGASRLLLHDQWPELAGAFKGRQRRPGGHARPGEGGTGGGADLRKAHLVGAARMDPGRLAGVATLKRYIRS